MFSLNLLLLLFITAVAARPFPRLVVAASSNPAPQPRDPPAIVDNPTRSNQISNNTFIAIVFCSFFFVLFLVLLTLLRKDRYRRLWRWLRNRHTQNKGHEPANVPSEDAYRTTPWARYSPFSPNPIPTKSLSADLN